MLVQAVVVGLLGGYGSVGFRRLIDWLIGVWPVDEFSTSAIRSLDWYWILVIPAAGGLIVGSITRWFAPEAKGHGVPEVMESVALRGGVIRPRVVGAKAIASGVCIATGGSVGREGPIVQIGAAIGSTVGQLLGMGRRKLRTLVGCGAAAGIAATFNAPVAGALFAVEVLLGDFAVHQFSPIVIAAVVATVVSRGHFGDLPGFAIPADQIDAYRLVHPGELLAYAGLGVLAGLVAIAFVRTLCFSEDKVEASKLPLPATAAIGGALVGAIALLFPDVLGVGYEAIERTLEGPQSWQLLAGLLVAKLAAVCITLGSGGSGGVFAPSLFLGAMLGGLVGLAVHAIAPGLTAPAGAYALVGMGSLVAATTRAPITTILIVFELTSDYKIMLPLMVSTIIATQFVRRWSRHSIYTIKLARRGVTIRDGQDVNILRSIPVREVLKTAPTIDAARGIRDVVDEVLRGGAHSVYVIDERRQLVGVVSIDELHEVLRDPAALQDVVVAHDLAKTHVAAVDIEENLDSVIEGLDRGYRDQLPVLEDGRLAGIVRIEDVLARYRRELALRETTHDPQAGDGAW
jgi:CIC family chloride channel protein